MTVSVQLAGDGQGRVTSEPPGIDCGGPPANCSATFPAGTRLTLRSRAELLSTTRGFSIAACTGRSCDATADLSADLAVSAYFDTQRYSVVVLGTPDSLHYPQYIVLSPNGTLGAGTLGGELADHLFFWDGSFHQTSVVGYPAVVSDLGTIAGNQLAPTGMGGAIEYHAFRWQNGVFTLLDTLGGTHSLAQGITAAGAILGSAARADGSVHAVYWVDQAPVDLGSLGGGCSEAFAGNGHGIIVGYSCFTGIPDQRPVRFGGAGIIEVLGTLGGTYGRATAINESGVIVGWGNVPSGDTHTFFHVDGRMVDIGTISGTTACEPIALNEQGIAVGSSWNFYSDFRTAIVATSDRLLDLSKLVPPEVHVTDATSIDAQGNIAASAIIGNLRKVVILRPE